jgi:hypothetical protein
MYASCITDHGVLLCVLLLQGERGDYYNPANSLLDHMLVDRQGLPIILSLVHVIVSRGRLAKWCLRMVRRVC